VTCELAHTTVHGYFDGELDAVRAADFERHVEYCAECSASLARMKALREGLQKSGLYERVSPQSRRHILDRLQTVGLREPRSTLWRWLLPAAAVFAMAMAIWAVLVLVPSRTAAPLSAAALIDAHIRSLQPGHLTDVASSDQHTVKPWFDGKLDFIPPVSDYAAQGFPLIGGRLDVLNGHTVAALAYGRRKHFINLFVWPAREGEAVAEGSGSRQGYHWMSWRSGDLWYCLVSDASPSDLSQLERLLRRQAD
jgi:anti-sigma factor RsiW